MNNYMTVITRSRANKINNYYNRISRSRSNELNNKDTIITEETIDDVKHKYSEDDIQSILQLFEKKKEPVRLESSIEEYTTTAFGYFVIMAVMSINVWQFMEMYGWDNLKNDYMN